MIPLRPPSQTAVASALMRAAHLLVDAAPHVFVDDLALPLSGWPDGPVLLAGYRAIEAQIAAGSSAETARDLLSGVRAITVMRARYVEDRVEHSLSRGARQYVILGAGLDSFAYRRRDLWDAVRVFEVDHPGTQAWKRERLRAAHVPIPPSLTFVPVDFEHEALIEALEGEGFRPEEPAFLSWMGVVNYLERGSIVRTLEEVAALRSGVELVFDYVLPDAALDAAARCMVSSLKADMASRGEPAVTFFQPEELLSALKEIGFSEATDIGPEEVNARYFRDRSDGLRLPIPCAARLIRVRNPLTWSRS